jgi:hypothetical protein
VAPRRQALPGREHRGAHRHLPPARPGLSAALGVQRSYWTGTLPSGPGGCNWGTVPLSYGPDPYNYGVWFLHEDARSTATHPASYALTALIEGVIVAYG